MKIGGVVRRLRKDRGLTLEAVAHAINSDPANLSRMERGERRFTLDLLEPVAKILDTSVSSICAEAEASQKSTPKDVLLAQMPDRFRKLSPRSRALVADLIDVVLKHEKAG